MSFDDQHNLFLSALATARLFPSIHAQKNPMRTMEYRALRALVPLDGAGDFLVLGSGDGLETLLLAQQCHSAVGLESDSGKLELSRRAARRLGDRVNCRFMRGKLAECGLAEESLDRIYAFSRLHRAEDPGQVLQRCHRMLKPGGFVVMSVWALEGFGDQQEVDLHLRRNQVATLFDRHHLRDLLKEIGYWDIRISPLFHSDLSHNYCRALNRGLPASLTAAGPAAGLALRAAESLSNRRDRGLVLVFRARKALPADPE